MAENKECKNLSNSPTNGDISLGDVQLNESSHVFLPFFFISPFFSPLLFLFCHRTCLCGRSSDMSLKVASQAYLSNNSIDVCL